MTNRTQRVIAIGLFGLAVGGAGVAWRDARWAGAVDKRHDASERDGAAINKEILAWTARREAAERATVASRAALVEIAKSSAPQATFVPVPASKVAVEKPAGTSKDPSEIATAMSAAFKKAVEDEMDPEWQKRWLAELRAAMRANYAPFYRLLGLTPAEIERFEGVEMRREEQQFDLGALIRAGKLSLQTPEGGKLWNQVTLDYEAGAKEVLGEANFQRLKDYERTRPMRNFASQLAGSAMLSGVPFTPDQAERLVQAMAEASAAYRKGGPANPTDVDWGYVDVRAGSFLNAVQLDWLKRSSVMRLTNEFDQVARRAWEADKKAAGGK